MTAKDKARELTLKFIHLVHSEDEGSKYNMKACALLCANEFIDALSQNCSPTAEGLTDFYNDVKKEINKL